MASDLDFSHTISLRQGKARFPNRRRQRRTPPADWIHGLYRDHWWHSWQDGWEWPRDVRVKGSVFSMGLPLAPALARRTVVSIGHYR